MRRITPHPICLQIWLLVLSGDSQIQSGSHGGLDPRAGVLYDCPEKYTFSDTYSLFALACKNKGVLRPSGRPFFGHLSEDLLPMASIERTAYPRFKPALTATELHSLYCPSDEERDFIAAHARGATQQLTLLTLLKGHQHLGYLPALADVPVQIRTYLCQQLNLRPLMYESVEAEKTLDRYRQLIRTDLEITPYGESGQAVVTTAVQHAAYTMSDPADLINLAVEHLAQLSPKEQQEFFVSVRQTREQLGKVGIWIIISVPIMILSWLLF